MKDLQLKINPTMGGTSLVLLILITVHSLILPVISLPLLKHRAHHKAQKDEEKSEKSHGFIGFCGNDLRPKLRSENFQRKGEYDDPYHTSRLNEPSTQRTKREAIGKGSQYTAYYQKLVAKPRLTEKFNKSNISWGVLDKSQHLNASHIDGLVANAFKIWAAVTPLTFYKEEKSPDIIIRFGTGLHGDCPVRFDNLGSQLGHSWTVGEVHINDALSRLHPNILPHVIVHELGHALGLPHDESDPSAIMYSVYYTPSPGGSSTKVDKDPDPIKLSQSDVDAIQRLYGVCNLQTKSISNLKLNKSYKQMFVVSDENNLIQSIESLSAKTEDTVTREHNCTVEQTGERGRVEFLLQMGKSHAYEAYAITSDLNVYDVKLNKTSQSITLSDPVTLTDKWPCFFNVTSSSSGDLVSSTDEFELVTSYYNRRDRTIYFYSGNSTNYMIYRFYTRTNQCLEPISFFNLHFDTTFPKFNPPKTPHKPSSDSKTTYYSDYLPENMTSTESYVTDDTSHINTVNDATDDAIYDAISAVTPDWFSTIKQSAYPLYIKESDIELVFQEHKSQETYVLTHDDFWRVRKSDYSLEFGGKIYENWPFLCTF